MIFRTFPVLLPILRKLELGSSSHPAGHRGARHVTHNKQGTPRGTCRFMTSIQFSVGRSKTSPRSSPSHLLVGLHNPPRVVASTAGLPKITGPLELQATTPDRGAGPGRSQSVSQSGAHHLQFFPWPGQLTVGSCLHCLNISPPAKVAPGCLSGPRSVRRHPRITTNEGE